MKAQTKRLFVTGIGTGIGKTVVSAVLTEALAADYWKPVQAGNLEASDTMLVRSLVRNSLSVIHPEKYRLQTACSPHLAARLDGLTLDPERLNLPRPDRERILIIEGAGGLLVPLREDFLVADLIKQFDASVVLVSQSYLGSINHTLLSLEALRARSLKLAGIIFNGESNAESEAIILSYSGAPLLGRIPLLSMLSADTVSSAAAAADFNGPLRAGLAPFFGPV